MRPSSRALVAAVICAWLQPSAAQEDQRSGDLFSPDPAVRKRAIAAAVNRPSVREDDWLRALDQRWPTLRDEEWSKATVCGALRLVGTRRSLPRLRALMAETPQVLERSLDSSRMLPAHDYAREARAAFDAIAARMAGESLDSQLGMLEHAARASALAQALGRLGESYRAHVPPEALEETPPDWWRAELASRLGREGLAGARGFQEALALIRDERGDARWKLIQAFAEQFARSGAAPGSELRTTIRAFCEQVLNAGEVRDPRELFVLDVITTLRITEAEEAIFAFAQRTPDASLRGRAVTALLEVSTDRAADFLIQLAPEWGEASLVRAPVEKLGPRALAALEVEPAWTDRFGFLARLLARSGWAVHVDRERLEAVKRRAGLELVEAERARDSAQIRAAEVRTANGRADPDAESTSLTLARRVQSIGAHVRTLAAINGDEGGD